MNMAIHFFSVSCVKEFWINDGLCDDGCNTKGYEYDGGDCCYPLGTFSTYYCTDCICHLGTRVPMPPCVWNDLHDGYCDDGCNNPDFNYDGGDCCWQNPSLVGCTDCLCHLDGQVHDNCRPHWPGDGFCDDVCNTIQFDYDSGDCCHSYVLEGYCHECFCYADGTRHPSAQDHDVCPVAWMGDGECDNTCDDIDYDFDEGDCCKSNWIEDGYCDDECNLIQAAFDGGDCCSEFIIDTACNHCICHMDGLRHPSGTLC